ncbi:MAG TPA: DUF4097 family beta strand repeat-containing protein [Candidatus Polarisedimenticolaceae bacterium]|nr:DUF4097 family beta strand repeat-containing protein [Candidatus Polarisedimenticolaceae bacterium]
MRRPAIVPFVLALLVAAAAPASADVTRSLNGSLTPGAGEAWAVENLAGTMKVVPGPGTSVTATVTVRAESDALASLLEVKEVRGPKGVRTLRVVYPIQEHTTYRYAPKGKSDSFLGGLFGGDSTVEYAGRQVKVSTSRGVRLYADVEVQVPARLGQGTLRNQVGRLQASGLEGTLRFDAASGDVDLERLKGTIGADTGSGDVRVTDGEGALDCDTGSGDISIEGFRGDLLEADVGSGDIKVRSGGITKVDLDTGSGDVSLKAAEVEEFLGDTGSGNLVLDIGGSRLRRVKASTGSGDVTLRLASDASFEVHVDQGSGDTDNRFPDAAPLVKGREVIGYKRGDGRTRIDVETGSGDFTLEPSSTSAALR